MTATYYASPALVPADATLEDLQDIRAGWLAYARSNEIPEKLYDICALLGMDIQTNHVGIFRSLETMGVNITIGVSQSLYSTSLARWETTRRVTIWRGEGLLVAWQWRYFSTFVTDTPDKFITVPDADQVFIPGSWLAPVLALYDKAKDRHASMDAKAVQAERDELAAKMLIGKDV